MHRRSVCRLLFVVLLAMVAGAQGCGGAGGEGPTARASDGATSRTHAAAPAHAAESSQLCETVAKEYRKAAAFDEAIAAMRRATSEAPDNADYWFGLGDALAEAATGGRRPWPEARAPLERCIQIDPNYAECHATLAWVLLGLDDDAGAIRELERAIRVSPADIGFYTKLADLYFRLDELEAALQVTAEAVRHARPNDEHLYPIHILAASVHQARGDLSSLVSSLEAAKAVVPADHRDEMLYNLGSTYARLQPPRKAEATQLLVTFEARACRGPKPQFAELCQDAEILLERLKAGTP